MQRRVQYILATLHLLVIIFWLGGTTLFVHSHIIDGQDIVHSHPYTGSADDHSHSTDSVLQISRIANVDMLSGDGSYEESIIAEFDLVESIDNSEQITHVDISGVSLRAPPVRA